MFPREGLRLARRVLGWGLLFLGLVAIVLLVACQPSAPIPISTPTPQEPERAPTWEECEPFARKLYDAAHRSDLAIAERNHAVHRSALTLENTWQPVVVDHAEVQLGVQYAKGTWAAQEANATIEETIANMPQGCPNHAVQWDALGAAMESPTFEQCSERREIAREAIPEHTRWVYAEEAFGVLDKLADKSSGVDAGVAHEVLGELIYADHRQLQEAAKAQLISLCSAAEWEKGAEELRGLGQ